MTRASQLNGAIRSERLLIEPLLGAHAELLFEPMSEPRLYRWISAQPPASRELLRKRWDAASSGVPAAHAKLNLNWAVQLVSDGAYVGKLDAQIGASEVGDSETGAGDLVKTGNVATNVGYIVFSRSGIRATQRKPCARWRRISKGTASSSSALS
ncbi:MAG TPA: hypothetical protein VER33_00345 [Polyangiaceae bacterium]|nr:hypothetical protein [Polyangiaceae bacterium]